MGTEYLLSLVPSSYPDMLKYLMPGSVFRSISILHGLQYPRWLVHWLSRVLHRNIQTLLLRASGGLTLGIDIAT